jgi:mRNA interferase MazF
MTRGEVWWAELPGLGRRPVLIMTRDIAIPLLRSLTVALFTRTVRGVPTEVLLDERDGLPAPSVVNFDDIRMVKKDALVSRLAMLSDARLEEVCEAFRYAVGC